MARSRGGARKNAAMRLRTFFGTRAHDLQCSYRTLFLGLRFSTSEFHSRREIALDYYTGEQELLRRAAEEYDNGNPNFHVNPGKTALLVIDLQEGFVAPGATMWTPQNLRILPNVARLIETCRRSGVPVIFTEHCHDRDGIDLGLMGEVPLNRPIRDGALKADAQETNTYHEIAPSAGERVIRKHRYSAFFDTDLETVLRGLGVDTLIISGCMTNYCCGATARDAFFRNYKVLFGSDITATDNAALHEAELKTLRRGFARVLRVEDILAEVEAATAVTVRPE